MVQTMMISICLLVCLLMMRRRVLLKSMRYLKILICLKNLWLSCFRINYKIFQVAPSLHMVQVSKSKGDTLEFDKFFKKLLNSPEKFVKAVKAQRKDKINAKEKKTSLSIKLKPSLSLLRIFQPRPGSPDLFAFENINTFEALYLSDD